MWKRIDIIFSLLSPLHIGYLPFKGSVISPTRYYVLGKNLWGAITKRTTEKLYENPSSKDYITIGRKINDNMKFSYFYLYDENKIYYPCFTEKGLMYGEIDKELISKYEFEGRFIGSRISTAIDSISKTSKDQTLHEIEFIKPKYKDSRGTIKTTKLIGSIWIKNAFKIDENEISWDDDGIFVKEILKNLFFGGELNSGYGLVKFEKKSPDKKIKFDEIKNPNDNEGLIVEYKEISPILSHIKYNNRLPFQGDLEILSGRGYSQNDQENNNYKRMPGSNLATKGLYFSPGTIFRTKEPLKFKIGNYGIMEICD